MTVTACSTPGGIQSARDGGTMVVPCGIVTRTTPVAEIAIWPQGWECGTTRVAASRCCSLARTGRAVGAKQVRRDRADGRPAGALAGSRQKLTPYRNPDAAAGLRSLPVFLPSPHVRAPPLSASRSPARRDAAVMGLVGLAHRVSHFSQLLLPPLFPG